MDVRFPPTPPNVEERVSAAENNAADVTSADKKVAAAEIEIVPRRSAMITTADAVDLALPDLVPPAPEIERKHHASRRVGVVDPKPINEAVKVVASSHPEKPRPAIVEQMKKQDLGISPSAMKEIEQEHLGPVEKEMSRDKKKFWLIVSAAVVALVIGGLIASGVFTFGMSSVLGAMMASHYVMMLQGATGAMLIGVGLGTLIDSPSTYQAIHWKAATERDLLKTYIQQPKYHTYVDGIITRYRELFPELDERWKNRLLARPEVMKLWNQSQKISEEELAQFRKQEDKFYEPFFIENVDSSEQLAPETDEKMRDDYAKYIEQYIMTDLEKRYMYANQEDNGAIAEEALSSEEEDKVIAEEELRNEVAERIQETEKEQLRSALRASSEVLELWKKLQIAEAEMEDEYRILLLQEGWGHLDDIFHNFGLTPTKREQRRRRDPYTIHL